MQANKNGFFYVLDRKSGALISAKAIVPMTWASGIDLKTGRPIENKDARYGETGKPVDVKPGPLGAHNWQPMAFNPNTGLVYIPAQQVPITFIPLPPLPIAPIGWNLGVALAALTLRTRDSCSRGIRRTNARLGASSIKVPGMAAS